MIRTAQNLGCFSAGTIPPPLNVSPAVAHPTGTSGRTSRGTSVCVCSVHAPHCCSFLCFCLTRPESICPLSSSPLGHLMGILHLRCSKANLWFPHPPKLIPPSSLLYLNNWQCYSFCSSHQKPWSHPLLFYLTPHSQRIGKPCQPFHQNKFQLLSLLTLPFATTLVVKLAIILKGWCSPFS